MMGAAITPAAFTMLAATRAGRSRRRHQIDQIVELADLLGALLLLVPAEHPHQAHPLRLVAHGLQRLLEAGQPIPRHTDLAAQTLGDFFRCHALGLQSRQRLCCTTDHQAVEFGDGFHRTPRSLMGSPRTGELVRGPCRSPVPWRRCESPALALRLAFILVHSAVPRLRLIVNQVISYLMGAGQKLLRSPGTVRGG
jgi:hypothetical protein